MNRKALFLIDAPAASFKMLQRPLRV